LEIDAKMFVVGKLKSRNICWRKVTLLVMVSLWTKFTCLFDISFIKWKNALHILTSF